MSGASEPARGYRRALWAVLGIAVVALAAETTAGYVFGSRHLVKDGTDWLYVIAVYAVAAISYDRSPRAEYLAGFALAAILVVAGLDSARDLVDNVLRPQVESAAEATVSTLFALVVAIISVVVLWPFRRSDDPVVAATWLSARNDGLSSAAGGLVTVLAPGSGDWPDLAAEVAGALLTFYAAFAVARSAWRLRSRTRRGRSG